MAHVLALNPWDAFWALFGFKQFAAAAAFADR
jgi:hypothetical protein